MKCRDQQNNHSRTTDIKRSIADACCSKSCITQIPLSVVSISEERKNTVNKASGTRAGHLKIFFCVFHISVTTMDFDKVAKAGGLGGVEVQDRPTSEDVLAEIEGTEWK